MTQTTDSKPPFGKLRSFLWPIHAYELKKLLPMFFLFFFINFNYTILRDTKDTLIVTAPGSGAEAIPFLKVWGVLPFAIVFMIVYAKLSNKMSKTKLFNTLIITFLCFFVFFALVLYPARDFLHPTEMADRLQAYLPAGFKGLVALFRNWTFALFYIMSELWGSIAISLLFWGFANDITRVSESKRFYAMFGLGANVAPSVTGTPIGTDQVWSFSIVETARVDQIGRDVGILEGAVPQVVVFEIEDRAEVRRAEIGVALVDGASRGAVATNRGALTRCDTSCGEHARRNYES